MVDAVPFSHSPEQPPKTEQQRTNENPIDMPIHKIQTICDIKIEKMDITLMANISICKKPLKLLIDCGSHASMIKSRCLSSNVLYYPQIKYCMVGINGPSSAIQTHGATFGNIKINDIQIKQQFQIAGDDIHLAYDGIIGMDFLCIYRAIIDLENSKLSILLPMNHNLYEFNERQMFEKMNPHIQKVQIKTKLLYLSDTEDKYIENKKNSKCKENKKILGMNVHINRLKPFPLESETNTKNINILPNCEKKFSVQTEIPLLVKEKIFDCGLFVSNTIISHENNTVSVYNASCNAIALPELGVDIEPLHNYHVYKINDLSKFATTHTLHGTDRIEKIMSQLDTSHCDDNEKNIIKKLVSEYNDIFYVDGDGLTFANEGEHRIHTKPGTNPVNTKQYRLPHGQKPLIREKIAEMLKHGIIEPSTSMWNSPILLVPKKSCTDKKEYRFCVDYKGVNKTSELQTFPMPNLDEELGKMHGAKYFSALDIASAFHQIKMREEDKEKTAFTAENKKFQFLRMPFGLAGSPITWQTYITAMLGDLLNTSAMAYMDDILIHTETVNEHIGVIIHIFDRLRRSGLKLNTQKTKLFCKRIEYLGHIINENGIKPNEKNTLAIKNMSAPKNIKEVQKFLGMASYFRKFIASFAKIAYPLNKLCRKDKKFEWSKECNNAFEKLKTALTTQPVLVFPDFNKQFYISVDASNYAVGGYISNAPPPNDKPIEYFSKTLNNAQQNYSTTEKELLAIILAIEQFRHFIWGKHFTLYTDHQALTFLFNHNKTNTRLLRWRLSLSEYSFDIIHRKGSNNVVSDCLSRINVSECIENTAMKAIMQAITRSRTKETELLINATPTKQSLHLHEEPSITFDDKKYDKILFIIDGSDNLSFKKLQLRLKEKINLKTINTYKLIRLKDNCDLIAVPKINFICEQLGNTLKSYVLTCQNDTVERIAINCGLSNFHTYRNLKQLLRDIFNKSEISITLFTGTQIEISDINDINEILRVYHRSLLGGHRGFNRMKNTIMRHYTWHTMSADIKKYIENCEICEKTKIHKHTHTPLQITSVASAPFEKIYIDFVGEINPNSADGHKYIMSISCDLTKYLIMKATFDSTALTAAKVIVEEVCLVYNFPKTIISDNGPAFTAEIFKQMAKLLDIKHIKTCPYHPQSNGSIERYHRTLGQYIRSYVQKNEANWHKYLPFFIFSYNTTIHSTTGFAPHTLVFGFDLKIPIKTKTSRQSYNYDSYHHELWSQLKEAQDRAKELIQERKMINKKNYDKKSYAELKLKRNDLVLLINETHKHKFDNKYSGPYRVEEVVSPAVSKIRKNGKSVIIHNDKLKKSTADHGSATPPPLPPIA